jgi:ferritin-like metal-binding protein YciE
MPATKISNPRDLVVQLLGELYFVERRLADSVLDDLAGAVGDEELKELLQRHRDQTKEHVVRIETAFRRLGVAATSNLSRQFESAVAEHDENTQAFVEPRLADLYHAQAALHTEHWEVAAYRGLIPLVAGDVRELLEPSLAEEGEAESALLQVMDRLAGAG